MLNLSTLAFHHKRVWDRRWSFYSRMGAPNTNADAITFFRVHKRVFELVLLHREELKPLLVVDPLAPFPTQRH
jgi:hypothetical protein